MIKLKHILNEIVCGKINHSIEEHLFKKGFLTENQVNYLNSFIPVLAEKKQVYTEADEPGISNSIKHISAVAYEFSLRLNPHNLSKAEFDKKINGALAQAKTKFGFDPQGPLAEQFKEIVAFNLWKQPIHPDGIPDVWKSLPFYISAKIFTHSQSPVQLSGNKLNRKEATEWITAIALDNKQGKNNGDTWFSHPFIWLLKNIKDLKLIPDSKLIVDWIAYQNKLKPGVFSESRTAHIPDQPPIEYTYGAIIDQITEQDLTADIKTNIQRAFKSAADRLGKPYIDKLKQDFGSFGSFPWSLLSGMVYLDTPAKIAQEGEEMHHCVGDPLQGYVEKSKAHTIYLVSITTSEGRSTAEILPNKTIKMHSSKYHYEPPQQNVDLVEQWEIDSKQLYELPQFETEEENGIIIITKYIGNKTDVIIPEVINELPVEEIGYRAFYTMDSITHIVIPDRVDFIGKGAFMGCGNLSHIIIPDRITRIEDNTFSNCRRLIRIILPNNITYIGDSAFWNCYRLPNILIPAHVKYIGKFAFFDCDTLTEVTIPKHTELGEDAFPETTKIIRK